MKIIEKIKSPEGRYLEFKETIPENESIAKTAVAFSNDGGGEIFLGIKNNPRIIAGIDEKDLFMFEEKIANIINDNCSPAILVDIVSVKVDNKYLLIVKIPKGGIPPYYLKAYGKDKGTYIRVGSSNRLASLEILQEIERKKLNISFDFLPVYDIISEKLDLTRFSKIYYQTTGKNVNKTSYEKLGLIKKEGDKYFATNAGILFSDNDIKKSVFPYSKIECARFKGQKTDIIIDSKTIDDSICLQAEKVIDFIERHINKGSKIGIVYREEKWEYPISAIREIIINAIVHRDYSLTGKDIKVAIFDDMLEITSPGTIPPSIDLNDLSTGQSEIRNKTIAPIFKELKLIEQWGTGFQKLFESLKEYPNLEVKFNQPALSFQVQLIKKVTQSLYLPEEKQYTLKLKDVQKANDYYSSSPQDSPHAAPHVEIDFVRDNPQIKKILEYCLAPRLRSEIQLFIGLNDRKYFSNKYINPLIYFNLVEMTIPDKPKSPDQRYKTTLLGEQFLRSESLYLTEEKQFKLNLKDVQKANDYHSGSPQGSPHEAPHEGRNFVRDTPQVKKILEYCLVPRLRSEIQLFIGLNDRKYFSNKYINPLIDLNLIEMTIPEKPQSPNQRYKTTLLGEQLLREI